tara:strand:- start:104 stop:709 length:606 start_codon:yes stop_codon:yes gene_type:complete
MVGCYPMFGSRGCHVPLSCPYCEEIVVVPVFLDYDAYNHVCAVAPQTTYNISNGSAGCVIAGQPYPAKTTTKAPDHVPEKIARAFIEAQENLNKGNLETCVLLCGKAMDLSTKSFDSTWKLERRLKKLATEGMLTRDMADWAEEIRLDRNTAIHEDHDFTPDQAKAIVSFTEAFLTYIYTLPAMVEAHRASKGEHPTDADE